MLRWFKKRNRARATAVQLYGSSVTQARRETFYASWGVPDTVEGRYEVIAMHLCLLALRLQREGEAGDELARLVFEAFVTEIDDSMREQGVADLKVPGRVRKAATGLYDRFEDYRDALNLPEPEALERALAGHFAGLTGSAVDCQAIAAYMRCCARGLAEQPAQELFCGDVSFSPLLA